jgi:hypothetical protein
MGLEVGEAEEVEEAMGDASNSVEIDSGPVMALLPC